jgi:hypothetical protein
MRVPPHWASSEEAVMKYALASLPDKPAGGVTARWTELSRLIDGVTFS